MKDFPHSLAVAGAWGYIGRRLVDAALRRGIRTYVHDPGPFPGDLDPAVVTRVPEPEAFYALDVDLFHLALHPETRRHALELLLRRAGAGPLWILNEKPLAAPGDLAGARRLVEAVDASRAIMLFDFPELFDPLTRRIEAFLRSFRRVELTSITLERSKDREDPSIPRNYKRMVPIQYQETVHCLAFALHLAGLVRGSVEAALREGLVATARSEPYCPPNPAAYPEPVDGRCAFRLAMGALAVEGLTDFKRGARWSKRRVVQGVGDGRPFLIEADYLEGRKLLKLDGVDQGWDPRADSYEAILGTCGQWHSLVPAGTLRSGPFPHVHFAWRTYQLSGVLWAASHRGTAISLPGPAAMDQFDPGGLRHTSGFA